MSVCLHKMLIHSIKPKNRAYHQLLARRKNSDRCNAIISCCFSVQADLANAERLFLCIIISNYFLVDIFCCNTGPIPVCVAAGCGAGWKALRCRMWPPGRQLMITAIGACTSSIINTNTWLCKSYEKSTAFTLYRCRSRASGKVLLHPIIIHIIKKSSSSRWDHTRYCTAWTSSVRAVTNTKTSLVQSRRYCIFFSGLWLRNWIVKNSDFSCVCAVIEKLWRHLF